MKKKEKKEKKMEMKNMENKMKIKIEDNRQDDGDGKGVYGFVTVYSNHNGVFTMLNRTWFWDGEPTQVTVHDDSIDNVVMFQEGPSWTKRTEYIGLYTRTVLDRK